jgi:hypothetical protein
MGMHRIKVTPRGKGALAGLTLLALVAVVLTTAAVAQRAFRDDGVLRPNDACASPPAMLTSNGVTLQPQAMRAFKKAEELAGHRIEVVQSYRSCSQQAAACERICQNPGGCPGRCAPPGQSYHQLGAAVDISQAMLDAPEVISALEKAGWCQSLPDSDPGHFSFGGCH